VYFSAGSKESRRVLLPDERPESWVRFPVRTIFLGATVIWFRLGSVFVGFCVTRSLFVSINARGCVTTLDQGLG
jgi:hypothetical protein